MIFLYVIGFFITVLLGTLTALGCIAMTCEMKKFLKEMKK